MAERVEFLQARRAEMIRDFEPGATERSGPSTGKSDPSTEKSQAPTITVEPWLDFSDPEPKREKLHEDAWLRFDVVQPPPNLGMEL
jgi:hypothetical protein